MFDERFDEQAQVGDSLALGRVVLVVAQVGLRFTGVGERLLSGK